MRKPIILSLLFLLFIQISFSQNSKKEVVRGWHLLDMQKDGYAGISLAKAYDFVKGKKSRGVIVAVIDGGVDTTHEDLKAVLWHNPGEIPGNGIDDDKNGYVDDVYGWNFLGGKDGRNVKEDSYEAARIYHHLKEKYEKNMDTDSLSERELDEFKTYLKAKENIEGGATEAQLTVLIVRKFYNAAPGADSTLKEYFGKNSYKAEDVIKVKSNDRKVLEAKATMITLFEVFNAYETTSSDLLSDFYSYYQSQVSKAEAPEKTPEDYRGEIVKDNYFDFNDRYYGNPDVMANTPKHGTHVSGIIGAIRNNGIGMDGIADNVKIMNVRAVPDGDEHDKDVALAIRYAVDNGARIINMSFGKSFSPQKYWVDDAVKYAESKGVLLVHAAGNDAKDNDATDHFPTRRFLNSDKEATNFIEVGASGDASTGGYVADFSDYGKKEVDVFAPGVKIYSTIPEHDQYSSMDGTSMASPVVSGIAAFILSYYPNLTPQDLISVIEKSAQPLDRKVKKPGTTEETTLSELCNSGGIVNAYEAIKLADALSKAKEKEELPKSKLQPVKKG